MWYHYKIKTFSFIFSLFSKINNNNITDVFGGSFHFNTPQSFWLLHNYQSNIILTHSSFLQTPFLHLILETFVVYIHHSYCTTTHYQFDKCQLNLVKKEKKKKERKHFTPWNMSFYTYISMDLAMYMYCLWSFNDIPDVIHYTNQAGS